MRRRRRRLTSRLAVLGVAGLVGVGAVGAGRLNSNPDRDGAQFVAQDKAPEQAADRAPGPAVAPAPSAAAEQAAEDAAAKAQRKAARAARRAAAGALPTFPQARGTYEVVPGHAAPADGEGRVVRYLVEVEKGLGVEAGAFAADVAATLADARSWGRGGRTMRFERVDSGPVRFRVSLSSPALTDDQCAPLRTYGNRSCFNGTRAVINAARWVAGAVTYGGDLAGYRTYVVNHEVGHALGHGHVGCPAAGAPAPVMVQQTKSLEGCAANPWPYRKARPA